jgi:hypothetical protein
MGVLGVGKVKTTEFLECLADVTGREYMADRLRYDTCNRDAMRGVKRWVRLMVQPLWSQPKLMACDLQHV